MKKHLTLYLTLLGMTIFSCSYDFPTKEENEQSIDSSTDFSSFYVIGDTYSSGFMDGALYQGGQEFSYPNLIGDKLSKIFDTRVFQQAEIQSKVGFNVEASESEESPKSKYSLLYRNIDSIYPARITSNGDEINQWDGLVENLNDFSIPTLKSYEADNYQELIQNSYFNRLNHGDATLLDLVIDRDPGVVLINLGYEDILSYALNGGAGNENPSPNNIKSIDLTPVIVFEESLSRVIEKILTQTKAEVFLANLINPLDTPYFKTLSYALEIEKYSSNYIGRAGAYYSDFNDMVFQYNEVEDGGVSAEQQRPNIILDSEGYPLVNPSNRARVIVDEYLSEASLNDGTEIPKWRQLTDGELILYKIEDKLNESSTLSGELPLSDSQALTAPEVRFIEQRVNAFNQLIERIASENERIHLIDISSLINSIKLEQYSYDGVKPSLKFDRYGIFSSDGYTFNPKGNALLANQFIQAINSNFNATLQLIDPNSYRGNEFLGSFD